MDSGGAATARDAYQSAVGPTLWVLLGHGLLMVFVMGSLVVRVGAYAEMFRDMRMALPSVTTAVIGLSDFARRYGVIAAPTLLLADGVVFFYLWGVARSKKLALAWAGGVALVLLGLLVTSLLAVDMPLLSLMDQLGGGS
ncbi:MAG: hypothetical protein FJ290_00735 [Planctomycetes bacterium]|nr:hypothetical protein [Planctomycetota bacterium]